ncbi:DMT family transporter [Alteromonadaceae bacterium BrNp21-10]|nr:DMT family transporter [Alteromonadaceae bacterium BrNp21-10]
MYSAVLRNLRQLHPRHHLWFQQLLTVNWSNETKGIALGLIAVILFSFTLPLSHYVTQSLDPWFVGMGRTAFGGLLAALILWKRRVPFPSRKQVKWLLLSSLGITLGFPVCISLAMSLTESSRGIIVVGILPLVTAVIGSILAKEKMPRAFWGFSLLGAALVFAFTASQQSSGPQWADLLLIMAMLSAGFGYATGGKLSKELPGWQVISWTLVLVMPLFWIPTALLFPAQPLEIEMGVWIAFAYLTIVSQLLGFFLWNSAMALGGIAAVSQTQLLQIFFSLLVADVLFGEELNGLTWVFAVLIIAVVALGNKTVRVMQQKKAARQAA